MTEGNALKAKWDAGDATINGWLSIGNSFTAEIMAAQGYDSLTVDIQHGFLDYGDARGMLQALRASGVVPMVRVPWNEPGIIMKSLDAGALGIICPMVNTAEQAAAFADCMRYPPRGNRSFGPTRVKFAQGDDYAELANDLVLAIAMIETAEAVANVDAICATAGIDGIYVGPSDLTLGVMQGKLPSGFDRKEPEMIEVIQKIVAAAKKAGIRAGIHTGTPDYAAMAIGWGFDFATVSGDVALLGGGAKTTVSKTRELLGQSADTSKPDTSGY